MNPRLKTLYELVQDVIIESLKQKGTAQKELADFHASKRVEKGIKVRTIFFRALSGIS